MREKPVPVVVQIVDRGRIETTVANTRSDTVKACRRVRLAPITGGQIAKLAVREGDHVESGQLLFSEQELKGGLTAEGLFCTACLLSLTGKNPT